MSRSDYCERHSYLHQQGGCPICEVEICGSLGSRISKLQDKLEKLLEEKVEFREPKVIEKEKDAADVLTDIRVLLFDKGMRHDDIALAAIKIRDYFRELALAKMRVAVFMPNKDYESFVSNITTALSEM
jgi:hypothetical protein